MCVVQPPFLIVELLLCYHRNYLQAYVDKNIYFEELVTMAKQIHQGSSFYQQMRIYLACSGLKLLDNQC